MYKFEFFAFSWIYFFQYLLVAGMGIEELWEMLEFKKVKHTLEAIGIWKSRGKRWTYISSSCSIMTLHHPFFSIPLWNRFKINLVTVFSLGRFLDFSSWSFLVYTFSWYFFFCILFSVSTLKCLSLYSLSVVEHLPAFNLLLSPEQAVFFSYSLKHCEAANQSPFFTIPSCSGTLSGTLMVTKDTSSWRKESLTFTQLEEIKINTLLPHI